MRFFTEARVPKKGARNGKARCPSFPWRGASNPSPLGEGISLRTLGDGNRTNKRLYPPVIKHGMLENGPWRSVIFLSRNLMKPPFSSGFPSHDWLTGGTDHLPLVIWMAVLSLATWHPPRSQAKLPPGHLHTKRGHDMYLLTCVIHMCIHIYIYIYI